MIKYLVMDVDGTLTDGKIYMGKNGESFKTFSIKDGAGIVLELPKANITPIIITARTSKILENRCEELNIRELHQGSKNKLDTLYSVLEKHNANLENVAYAGDDLPDLPCMEAVKNAGGAVLCPSDAIPEIKAIANYVSGFRAGEGAIRDCINFIVQRNKINVEYRVRKVIDCILAGDYSDGMIDGNPYTVQEYFTKDEEECILESHRKHIDVQYIIEGTEEFKIYMTYGLTGFGKYHEDKDVEFWGNGIVSSHSLLVPGNLVVIYNGQPHKGAIRNIKSESVKKLVCKIKI